MPATASTINACIDCSGSGFVKEEKVANCRLCSGNGHFEGEPCFICGGDGFEMKLAWAFCPSCGRNTDN